MTEHKDVFISYSHADSDHVQNIAEDLKAKGLNLWIDEWDIHPGANITKTINEGLKASRYLLLLLSANSLKSRWVKEEWTAKYSDEINKGRITIIPMLIDPVDITTLPPFLANKKIVDLSKNYAQTIEHTANYLLSEVRSSKEQQSLKSIKELFGSMDMSSRKTSIIEIKKGIIRRIAKANERGWSSDRCIIMLKRELDFAYQEMSQELDALEKKYNEDPGEFEALQRLLLSGDHNDLKVLKGKVEYIMADENDPDTILEEIQLELDLLSVDDNPKTKDNI